MRRKERRLSRQGRPFLALTLVDASGAVPAVVFDEPDYFAGQFEEGDRVRVTGRVTERDGRHRVVVSHLRPAGGTRRRPRTSCRAAHRDPDELFGFVLHLADEVADRGAAASPGRPHRRCRPGARLAHDAVHPLRPPRLHRRAWSSTRWASRRWCRRWRSGTRGSTPTCFWPPRWSTTSATRARSGWAPPSSPPTRGGCWATWRSATRSSATPPAARACRRSAAPSCCTPSTGTTGRRPASQPGGASAEALALWRANQLETGVKGRLEGPGPGADGD